jgi:hypothetical protein
LLYYEGIEEILFNKHQYGSEIPDELIIISGYLGPAPVERLSELPMKTTVIGGMYSSGIHSQLWNALEKSKQGNSDLSVYFSKREIHSKIYIWKKDGKILSALVGSANFSSKGLRTDYRETLADATRDTHATLERYYRYILDNSIEDPEIDTKQRIIDFTVEANERVTTLSDKKYSYDIPLYSATGGEKSVPPASGLNWGLGEGHVAPGDAYIRLPKTIIKDNHGLISPYDEDYTTPDGKRARKSDPIELIWDDGTVMEASLEGVQNYNGEEYPKQLASYSSKTPYLDGERISKKSILGRYLRNRLNVDVNEQITLETLQNFGRDTVTLSLIEDGIYYADFSVNSD